MRKLYGHAPITAVYAGVCIAATYSMTFLVYKVNSWWLTAALTLLVGPFIDMMALVVMHEVSHNLVFAKPWANRLLGIAVNTVMGIPIR